MSSYENFQSDNKKYTKSRTNIFKPEFNSTIKPISTQEQDNFTKNLSKYIDFIMWARWMPDLFFDLITPETGGIRLDLDQRVFLRSLVRFITVYGVFPRGYAKCVSGDTILFTNDGLKEIGSYFNYIHTGKEFYTMHSIYTINKKGKLEHSDKGVYSGYLNTKKIKTEEGYSLEGTLNHPILIMNNNGELKYKEMQNIKIGDYVVINRNNNIWGTNINLDLSLLDKWYNECSLQKLSKYKKVLPTQMNENISLLMGYLLGDGCLTHNNVILFSNKDEDIINNTKNIFQNEFNVCMKKKKGNNDDYVVYNIYLRKYFDIIGLHQYEDHDKEIPDCILSAPKNIILKTVQGLFDTDGIVSKTSISFCSASEKLVKQVQLILLNCGIISTVLKNNIYIYGENIDKFAEQIGFSCSSKNNMLKNLLGINRNRNKNIVAHQENNILDNLNYFYSKIKFIEDSNNHVYDLQMSQSSSFISNGFVSHNTFLQVLTMFHTAIFYPDIELTMTAQTRENASKLLKEKYNEIIKFYPLITNEILHVSFQKDMAEIDFTSGSKIDIMANHQSSKGARRKRLNVEEAALLNNQLFEDVLEPIVNIPRRTIGKKAEINPEELNGQINFFTTSGFRGSDEFNRNLRLIDEMAELNGKILLGSDWKLPCAYGRGETKSQILDKKSRLSPISFSQNYESRWVGAVDNALININKILNLRTLSLPQTKRNNRNSEYILGVDVARSQDTGNNQTSVVVLELKRNNNGKITNIMVVNIITISNALNFTSQACEVKKIQRGFDAKIVVVDSNGLGVGLVDELMKESIEPNTGENLGCWNTINTDDEPEFSNAQRIIYDLKPQSAQSNVIVTFIDMVESGKLRLLEKRQDVDYDVNDKANYTENILPFIQTDFLVEEISNLQLRHLSNNKLSIEKMINKIGKDRYSALSYGLWYIKTFEDNVYHKEKNDFDILQEYTFLM